VSRLQADGRRIAEALIEEAYAVGADLLAMGAAMDACRRARASAADRVAGRAGLMSDAAGCPLLAVFANVTVDINPLVDII
jgi:hypothetical protein